MNSLWHLLIGSTVGESCWYDLAFLCLRARICVSPTIEHVIFQVLYLVLCNLCSIYLLQKGFGFILFILFPTIHFVHLLIGVVREYSAHIHCVVIILAVWMSKTYKERDILCPLGRHTKNNLIFSIFIVETKWITEWHELWLR